MPMRAEKCVAGGWISLGLDGTVALLARRHVTGYPMADFELGSIDLTAPTNVAVANILILIAA